MASLIEMKTGNVTLEDVTLMGGSSGAALLLSGGTYTFENLPEGRHDENNNWIPYIFKNSLGF